MYFWGWGLITGFTRNAKSRLLWHIQILLQFSLQGKKRKKNKSIILRCGLFPQEEVGSGFCRFYWDVFSLQKSSTVIEKLPQSSSATVTRSPKGTNTHLLLLENPWDEMFALREDAEEGKSLFKGKKKIQTKNFVKVLILNKIKRVSWQEGESGKGNILSFVQMKLQLGFGPVLEADPTSSLLPISARIFPCLQKMLNWAMETEKSSI